MNIPAILATVTAAGDAHVVNELPMPAEIYGIAIFAILMLMLLATMSLRSVRERAEEPGGDDYIARNRPGLYDNTNAKGVEGRR